QLNVTAWGTGNTNASTAPIAGGPAPATGPIGLDFHDTTSLAASTQTQANGSSATVLAQNGYAAGILNNITVGQDGTVTGAFSNGQTQSLAQVAVATFQNEQGLQRLGSSQFAQTSNSGLAQLGTGGSGRFGAIISGALEQSNVSIADEFTKMISAQNAYQANSKSITTASEDLQTVIGLIR
ncbi:MAG: flagellar hook-basal body complex protein, partial [Candidatus Eremiobacteraeota bacterium]|nr:flagellar hook-basal body complex protein [Candidatus Eremiobacteraeota bacterium]